VGVACFCTLVIILSRYDTRGPDARGSRTNDVLLDLIDDLDLGKRGLTIAEIIEDPDVRLAALWVFLAGGAVSRTAPALLWWVKVAWWAATAAAISGVACRSGCVFAMCIYLHDRYIIDISIYRFARRSRRVSVHGWCGRAPLVSAHPWLNASLLRGISRTFSRCLAVGVG